MLRLIQFDHHIDYRSILMDSMISEPVPHLERGKGTINQVHSQ